MATALTISERKGHVMERYQEIKERCEAARVAARAAAAASGEGRAEAITGIVRRLVADRDRILEANRRDVERSQGQLSDAALARLTLDEGKLAQLCDRLLSVAAAPDPLGTVSSELRPTGFEVAVKRAPLGAVAFVYDCRPQLTALAAAVCIKTANAALLSSCYATVNTDGALLRSVREALRESVYSPEGIAYIDPLHLGAAEMLSRMKGTVDMMVVSGGLAVAEEGGVPLIRAGGRVCHVYIDKQCDLPASVRRTVKSLYPGGSEPEGRVVVLVHKDAAEDFLPALRMAVKQYHPELRGCPVTREYLEDAIPAVRGDWSGSPESEANILAVRVVESMEMAVSHVNTYGTAHSDAIMTSHIQRAKCFEREVDSRVVWVNAPLRGSVLSDSASAALGLVGLHALTRQKYVVSGPAEEQAI